MPRWPNPYIRVLAMIDTSGGPDACHEWLGGVGHYGHGVTHFPGIGRVPVHRLFWIIEYGDPGSGVHILHRCDNPPCCNVRHLFIGTQADNIADMYAKHRDGTSGERNARAKLTTAQVQEIRVLSAGGMSQRAIGRMFGVNGSAVWKIVNNHNRRYG